MDHVHFEKGVCVCVCVCVCVHARSADMDHVHFEKGVCVCMCVCVYTLGHSVMSNSLGSMDYSPPGSSIHGILQVRLLQTVAISYSRGSS